MSSISHYLGFVLNRTYVIAISFSMSCACFGNRRFWPVQICNGFVVVHAETGNHHVSWVSLHVLAGYPKSTRPWLPGPSLRIVSAGNNLEGCSNISLRKRIGLHSFTIKAMIPPSSVFSLCNASIHHGYLALPHCGLRNVGELMHIHEIFATAFAMRNKVFVSNLGVWFFFFSCC